MKARHIAMIVAVGLVSWACWTLNAFGIQTALFRAKLKPGMTLREADALARSYGGWYQCSGMSLDAQAARVRMYRHGYVVMVNDQDQHFENTGDFFQAAEKRMKDSGTEWNFDFAFSTIPWRTHVDVRVGPDGTVKRVSESLTGAD